MAFDYGPFAALASELITEFGRSVAFVKLGQTPTDPSQPWLGTSTARTSPEEALTVDAVFVEPTSLDQLGNTTTVADFVARSTQIALVYSTAALEEFNEITDTDGSTWRIQGMTRLQPANAVLLFYVGVSR